MCKTIFFFFWRPFRNLSSLCVVFFAELLPKKNAILEENTFTYTLAMLSLRSLSKLLISASHFNFSTNITSLLVRLATSKYETVSDCKLFSEHRNNFLLASERSHYRSQRLC